MAQASLRQNVQALASPRAPGETATAEYARLLQSKQQVWWKKFFRVQAPYQWNIRRQKLGRTLEIGCGIGRNLGSLGPGSIGVDHNPIAARVARAGGFGALDILQWDRSAARRPESFDGLLVSHVLEHLDEAGAEALLADYLPYLKPGGKLFIICPQEVGYASDATHVHFFDGEALTRLAARLGLRPRRWFSFPFPRWTGRYFIYNEFCLIAEKPARPSLTPVPR